VAAYVNRSNVAWLSKVPSSPGSSRDDRWSQSFEGSPWAAAPARVNTRVPLCLRSSPMVCSIWRKWSSGLEQLIRRSRHFSLMVGPPARNKYGERKPGSKERKPHRHRQFRRKLLSQVESGYAIAPQV
jgi:hypothetical protein